jgi:hypothetical protein
MGGAMGVNPRDIKVLSIWEFLQMGEGYRAANGGGETGPKAPTPNEYNAMLEKHGFAPVE